MEIKDFKIGDIVYCRLTGNEARGRKKEELIEEWEIVKIGRKYVTAKPKGSGNYRETQFEIDKDYKQKTNYCVGYVLYSNMQDILDEDELRSINCWFKDKFGGYGSSKFSLESLRMAKEILESDKKGE